MKTFLTPLSTQEENAYLRRMASGDREAKRKLVEHNMRLVAHVAKKYYNSEDDMEDLISIGTIGLLKAVDTYNPGKGSKLATYAARCIDNELLMYFRGKKKRRRIFPYTNRSVQTRRAIRFICLTSWRRRRWMWWSRWNTRKISQRSAGCCPVYCLTGNIRLFPCGTVSEGNAHITQREAAQRLGISRSYVSRIEKKALGKLREAFFAQNGPQGSRRNKKNKITSFKKMGSVL